MGRSWTDEEIKKLKSMLSEGKVINISEKSLIVHKIVLD